MQVFPNHSIDTLHSTTAMLNGSQQSTTINKLLATMGPDTNSGLPRMRLTVTQNEPTNAIAFFRLREVIFTTTENYGLDLKMSLL